VSEKASKFMVPLFLVTRCKMTLVCLAQLARKLLSKVGKQILTQAISSSRSMRMAAWQPTNGALMVLPHSQPYGPTAHWGIGSASINLKPALCQLGQKARVAYS
jgi:hypothetical protein